MYSKSLFIQYCSDLQMMIWYQLGDMHYYSSWQCAKLLPQRVQIKNWCVFYICQCVVITGTRSSTNFHSRKCIWIYSLHNVGHFDQVSTKVTRWRGMFIHRPLAHGRCGNNFERTAFKFIESAKTTSMQKESTRVLQNKNTKWNIEIV